MVFPVFRRRYLLRRFLGAHVGRRLLHRRQRRGEYVNEKMLIVFCVPARYWREFGCVPPDCWE